MNSSSGSVAHPPDQVGVGQLELSAGVDPTFVAATREPNHLCLANQFINDYDHRINQDNAPRDLTMRQLYEDRAYKQAMMHAAYAQAEAMTEMAAMLRGYLATYCDPAVFTKE